MEPKNESETFVTVLQTWARAAGAIDYVNSGEVLFWISTYNFPTYRTPFPLNSSRCAETNICYDVREQLLNHMLERTFERVL